MAKSDKVKLSVRQHPLYEDNLENWDFYKSAADGGDDFITRDNLFTHRLEDEDDYTDRLDRGYYLNFCRTMPEVYNSFIFRENINRAPDEQLDEFRRNVDGQGTSISDFIKLAGYWSSVYGVMHALVDVPAVSKPNKKSITKADQKSMGLYPFARLIHPQQIRDWSLDEKGNYRWVILEYTYYKDFDPFVEREEEKHYKLITKDEWLVEDEDGNVVKYDDGSPSNGKNPLGFVPIITMYHAESEPKIGRSLIKDVSYINRVIMNWCSCIDEQIERQTFSQLVIPDDGSLVEDSESSDPLHKVGTSSVFTFNADSKHPPSFISPEAENLSVVWKLIVDHIKEVYRLSGLQGGTSDLYSVRSGKQAQLSFSGVNSALAEKSSRYEGFENGLSAIAYSILNKPIDTFNYVVYPKSFDVIALSAELDSYFDIIDKNFSTRLNKILMKNISRRVAPTVPIKDREAIEDEIEAGDGIIKTRRKDEKVGGEVGNPNTSLGDTFRTSDENEYIEKGHKKKDEE